MDCAVGKVLFCSISRKERVIYSYNGGDSSVESLARLCLAHAPPFHSHYFHTTAANRRTFAFLSRADLTYFLIVDQIDANSNSKPRILGLLHQIHHGFFGSGRAEIVAVVRSLIESTEESMNRQQQQQQQPIESTSTNAPLLEEEEAVSMEVGPPDPEQLQQQLQKRRLARGLWWRHAKIVAVADVAVCGVLFGVWMAVCRGFRCVS